MDGGNDVYGCQYTGGRQGELDLEATVEAYGEDEDDSGDCVRLRQVLLQFYPGGVGWENGRAPCPFKLELSANPPTAGSSQRIASCSRNPPSSSSCAPSSTA